MSISGFLGTFLVFIICGDPCVGEGKGRPCAVSVEWEVVGPLLPMPSFYSCVSSSRRGGGRSIKSIQQSVQSNRPCERQREGCIPRSVQRFQFSPPIRVPHRTLMRIRVPFPTRCFSEKGCFQRASAPEVLSKGGWRARLLHPIPVSLQGSVSSVFQEGASRAWRGHSVPKPSSTYGKLPISRSPFFLHPYSSLRELL